MSETINPSDFPTIDRNALETLRQMYQFDIGTSDALMHELVEEDPYFAEQITAEGYRLSGGSIERQTSFINGAKFARAAIKRTLALRHSTNIDTEQLLDWLTSQATADADEEHSDLRGGGETLD